MRKLLFILPLLAMTGCGLMNSEYGSLNRDDPVVAAILASQDTQAEKLAALSDHEGRPIVDYGEVGDALVARFQPALDESVDAAIKYVADNAPTATSPQSLILLLLGAGMAGVGTLGKRVLGETKVKK